MKSFTTRAKERKVVEFEIDDRQMTFTMPKRSGLIISVVDRIGTDVRGADNDSTRDLLNWIGEGLSEEDATWLLDRLKDPDDDYDLEDVNELARYLLGQGTNRPTRRRSGS